jgi:FkbM family methyltransferase
MQSVRAPALRTTLAGQRGVRLVERAVWDADGPLSFFPVVHTVWNGRVVSNPGASSCFRTVSGYHQEYTQTEVVVEALRLDTYCDGEGITAPDLLCVDAQGGALHGLRGLGRYLDAVRAVIIEIEHREVFIGGDLYPAVDTFLRHAGFDQAVVIEHDGLVQQLPVSETYRGGYIFWLAGGTRPFKRRYTTI